MAVRPQFRIRLQTRGHLRQRCVVLLLNSLHEIHGVSKGVSSWAHLQNPWRCQQSTKSAPARTKIRLAGQKKLFFSTVWASPRISVLSCKALSLLKFSINMAVQAFCRH